MGTVTVYRILLIVLGTTYSFWNVVGHRFFLPPYRSEFVNGISHELDVQIFVGTWLFLVPCLSFVLTFKSRTALRYIYRVFLANVYLITLHLLYLTRLSNVATFFVICMFIFLFSVAPCFRTVKSYFYFAIFFCVAGYLFCDVDKSIHSAVFASLANLTVAFFSYVGLALSIRSTERERALNDELVCALSKLKHQKTFSDSVLDLIPQPLFMKDRFGVYKYVNKRGCGVFGLSKEQIIGKSDHEIFPKALADIFVAEDAESFIQKHTTHENTVPFDDGLRDFIICKAVINDFAGEEILVGICTDITSQKREVTHSKQIKDALNLSQKIAKIGTFNYTVNDKKLWWSDEMYDIFGFKRGDFIPTQDFVEEFYTSKSRETRRIAMEGSTVDRPVYQYVTELVRRDGVKLHIHVMAKKEFDSSGDLIGFLGTLRDITTEKEAQDKLRLSEESLHMALESGKMGSFFARRDSMTVTYSKKFGEIIGLPQNDKLVATSAELESRVHPDDLDNLRKMLNSDHLDGTHPGFEHRIIASNGSVRWVYTSASVIKEDGRGIALAGISMDITERRKAEQTLRRASKMKALGEMAGGIAHEIKNPLTSIMGNLADLEMILEEGEIDRESAKEDIEAMKRIVYHVDNIVSGLRSMSRDTTNDPAEPVQIMEIIDQTLNLCRERFKDKGIEVTISGLDATVQCRRAQISQVLMNLLGNSFDAIQESAGQGNPKKWIRIEVIDSDTMSGFSVVDSGPEITLKIREQIFAPLFTTKSAQKGTGLGLSISKSIAASHDGSLELLSGTTHTTFRLLIPKAGGAARLV